MHVSKLAFSQETLQLVQTLLPNFDAAISNFRINQAMHLAKNKEYPNLLKKAKLYVSHFIQVVNMAIARGEIKSEIREFYGISEYDGRVPDLNTEADLLLWGKKIVTGETERMQKGQPPITNPSIALVKVWFEQFCDAHYYKVTHNKSASRVLRNIAALRRDADDLILNLWNEVEAHYQELPDEMMREWAATYGVVYVFRPHELKNAAKREQQTQRTRSLFEP